MINNRYAKPFSISAIILGLHLLTTANAFIKFCSVVCANQSCNSNAYADCIECADPWTLSNVTNRCQISTLSQWSLVNYSSDVNANGSIIPNFTSTAFCNTSVSGEWSYRYSGNILGKNITRYTYTLGPTVPHYQVRVIFWMLLVQQWRDSDLIVGFYNGVPQSMLASEALANHNLCNGTKVQRYLRFDKTYAHNTSGASQIRITTLNNISSAWGVKEVFLFARKCHQSCASCNGPLSTQCFGCISTMYLSNTTCSVSCLVTYGLSASGNVCIKCDSRCLVCFYVSLNCTQCLKTGVNSSFLVKQNNTCLAACPLNMFTNSTDRVCYQCNFSLGFLLINGTTCIYCPISNCTFCSVSGGLPLCQSCSPGYNLSRASNLCIECSISNCLLCEINNICKNCEANYNISSIGTCIQCNVDNCVSCQQENYCKTCQSRYNASNGSCLQCFVQNCMLCYDQNQCQQCQTKYSVQVTGECVLCDVEGCLFCQDLSYCKSCQQNYNLINGSCTQCNVDHCLYCQQPNKCVSCQNGTILYQFQCFQCNIERCQVCSSVNRCFTCLPGYLVKNNVCVQNTYEKQVQTTFAIIATCAAIVLLTCLFAVAYCCRYYRNRIWNQLSGKKKLNFNYRQQTKADFLQYGSNSRRVESLKVLNIQNSILQIQPIDPSSRSNYRTNKTFQQSERQYIYQVSKKRSTQNCKNQQQIIGQSNQDYVSAVKLNRGNDKSKYKKSRVIKQRNVSLVVKQENGNVIQDNLQILQQNQNVSKPIKYEVYDQNNQNAWSSKAQQVISNKRTAPKEEQNTYEQVECLNDKQLIQRKNLQEIEKQFQRQRSIQIQRQMDIQMDLGMETEIESKYNQEFPDQTKKQASQNDSGKQISNNSKEQESQIQDRQSQSQNYPQDYMQSEIEMETETYEQNILDMHHHYEDTNYQFESLKDVMHDAEKKEKNTVTLQEEILQKDQTTTQGRVSQPRTYIQGLLPYTINTISSLNPYKTINIDTDSQFIRNTNKNVDDKNINQDINQRPDNASAHRNMKMGRDRYSESRKNVHKQRMSANKNKNIYTSKNVLRSPDKNLSKSRSKSKSKGKSFNREHINEMLDRKINHMLYHSPNKQIFKKFISKQQEQQVSAQIDDQIQKQLQQIKNKVVKIQNKQKDKNEEEKQSMEVQQQIFS